MSLIRVEHFGKFLPPVVGGMETSIYEICSSLSKLGNMQIRLVGANTENKRVHEVVNPNFETTKLANFREIFSTPILRGIRDEVADFDPQIIHLHLPNPYISYFLKSPKQPLVITYHCEILTYPTLLKMYSPILNQALSSASRIIATSEQVIDHSPFLKNYKSKCTVIPLGIPRPALLESKVESEKIKSRHGQNLILFVGRLVPYKGLFDLISAMKTVEGKLLIAGNGPQKDELISFAKQNELEEKVEFLGFVSDHDLKNYFQAARIVALTSLDEREAFGMCLVEGLSYAKPLVTTRVPSGVQFVNKDGYSGLSADVGNVPQISQALSRLLTDPTLWQKFSNQAIEHFNKNFEIGAVAKEYQRVYREVL